MRSSLRAWRPARYPSDAAPAFGLRCAWLSDSQLAALATRLDELWEEQGPGAGILLSWIEWLRHESAAFLFGEAAAGDALRISLVPTDGDALLDPADAVAASGGRRAQRWPRGAAFHYSGNEFFAHRRLTTVTVEKFAQKTRIYYASVVRGGHTQWRRGRRGAARRRPGARWPLAPRVPARLL